MHKQNWPVLCIVLTLPCCGAEKIDDGLRQAVDQVLYRVNASAPGVYRSDNPAQRLSIEFDAAGTRLRHPEGTVGSHLVGYGYGENLRTPEPASPVATGSKVEYCRGDLTEWYKNEAGGLEQGFTLTRRPGIAQDGEPLVIALKLDGALQPALSPEGDAVLLGSALHYAGLHSWDARGRAILSRLEVREQEIRIVIDDRDAVYPLVVDPTWVQQQELTDVAGAQADVFGYSVAVDGNTAVIGAWLKTIGQNVNQGAAFVFVRSGSPPVWTLQQELTAPDGAAHDGFGLFVSISEDTVVVGSNTKAAAYVFVRSGLPPVWALQQELTPSGMASNFGSSVSLDGNTLAVGSPHDSVVYVFARGATTPPWTLQQALTISGVFGLGRAVAVSGDTIVAGAGSFSNSGPGESLLNFGNAAYIFVRGAATPPWTLQQVITGADDSQFASSVALSGDTAVIGAPAEYQQLAVPPPPSAYVYVRGATSPPWTQQQQLTPPAGSFNFGWSVALSGDTAVVGGFYGTSAYVFARSGAVWSQQHVLTPFDSSGGGGTTSSDGFGNAVAISGTTMIVGAFNKQIGSNSEQGAAYVFMANGPLGPLAGPVTPYTGGGLGPQTFTSTYTDPNGASDLQVVYLDVATAPGAISSCFAAYVRASNSLYLFSDTNGAILGPITPGSGLSVSNSQCTLSGAGGTVTSSGTVLIVPFLITFAQPAFGGAKNVYGLAQNYAGNTSDWQLLGTWIVPSAGPPSAVSVTPNGGGGLTQTFTVTYTDPAGASDLKVVYLQIGLAGGGAYSCFAAYMPASNWLYLFDDTNMVFLGPIVPGSNFSESNTRCALSGDGGVVTNSGNNLIVPFSLTFRFTYTGQKNILGYAQNYSGANSGFQMLGTWTPAPGGTLSAVSVTPVNGSGFGPQTFSAVYSDSAGGGDIQAAYLDFGPSIVAAHSCIVVYVTGNRTLFLFNDDNTGALGPIAAGTNSTLSNSQCTLSGSGGLATPSGNNLTVPFNLTFTPAFASQQMVFGLAQTFGGTQSPWANLGTWTP